MQLISKAAVPIEWEMRRVVQARRYCFRHYPFLLTGRLKACPEE